MGDVVVADGDVVDVPGENDVDEAERQYASRTETFREMIDAIERCRIVALTHDYRARVTAVLPRRSNIDPETTWTAQDLFKTFEGQLERLKSYQDVDEFFLESNEVRDSTFVFRRDEGTIVGKHVIYNRLHVYIGCYFYARMIQLENPPESIYEDAAAERDAARRIQRWILQFYDEYQRLKRVYLAVCDAEHRVPSPEVLEKYFAVTTLSALASEFARDAFLADYDAFIAARAVVENEDEKEIQ